MSHLHVVDGGGNDPSSAIFAHLATSKEGKALKTLGNVLSILSIDPRWSGVIAYDSFAEMPVVMAQPPQRDQDAVEIIKGSAWSPQDSSRAATWLHQEYDLIVPSTMVTEAMLAVAQQRAVHPIRRYLDDSRWDAVPRLDRFFTTYCGVPDSPYARGVARMFFVSAIARVRRPGSKVDTIVVLEGPQGLGKSRLLSKLGSPWFADTPISLGDKDAYQALRGIWLYELAEMVTFKGRDATRIKSFASSPSDHFRPSYEPRARSVPRQCVFIGTTNETDYLGDPTGARRFWPVRLERIDLQAVDRDRDQLWAEADALFHSEAMWWPDATLDALGAEATEERFEGDPWEGPLLEWLAKPTRTEHFGEGRSSKEPLDPTDGFAMSEILNGALSIPTERQSKREQERVAVMLRRAGWCREKNPRRVNGQRIRHWFNPGVGVVPGVVPGGGAA